MATQPVPDIYISTKRGDTEAASFEHHDLPQALMRLDLLKDRSDDYRVVLDTANALRWRAYDLVQHKGMLITGQDARIADVEADIVFKGETSECALLINRTDPAWVHVEFADTSQLTVAGDQRTLQLVHEDLVVPAKLTWAADGTVYEYHVEFAARGFLGAIGCYELTKEEIEHECEILHVIETHGSDDPKVAQLREKVW